MNVQQGNESSGRERGECPLAGLFARVRLSHLGLLVLVFGLLLWARFLLVTGHPRTAIADPPQASPNQHVSAAPADPRP